MKFRSILAAFSIVLGSTFAAMANGAWSEFPVGGVVVFKPEKKIRIAREDLEIGWKLIRVRYVFVSDASEAVERTIGFPMAKVLLEDGPDHIENRAWVEDGDDPRNYMAFRVAVNGEPLTPELHEYAWSGDTNVNQRILDLGLPLFAADSETYGKLAQLPEATLRELKRDNLLVWEEHPDADWLAPKWEYQAVYEWTQTFAPGETIVEVSYRPFYGSYYGPEPYYPGGERSAQYCYDDATRQKLTAAGSLPTPFTVGYILTTAQFWNGPIRDFHLKITKDEGDLVSFCVPDGLFAAGDGKNWEANDFVPRADLNIVFFDLD